MAAKQSVSFVDPVNNTEAFYQLVEVRPRVIRHKIKVRPQVEGYEVSVGGGYTAPCRPVHADYLNDYRDQISSVRRSRLRFLDDYAIDDGYSWMRHCYSRYPAKTLIGSSETRGLKALTNREARIDDDFALLSRPRRRAAIGDASINVSKRTIRF